MDYSTLPFDPKDIQRVLGSQEGQQILKLLQQDGGKALKAAATAYRQGNTQKAQEIIAPLMTTPEATRLVDKLNQKR